MSAVSRTKKKLESRDLLCIKFSYLGLKKWWKRILTITEIWTSLLGVAELLLCGPRGVMETDHSSPPPLEDTGGPTWRLHVILVRFHSLPLDGSIAASPTGVTKKLLRLYWSWTALLDGVPTTGKYGALPHHLLRRHFIDVESNYKEIIASGGRYSSFQPNSRSCDVRHVF
ncbi:hypothetical protein GJAV_G00255960 [Gymnothorax javanicus]|nr:hypothetical protein GJAV_G00255960 [Gymnothorax javanicus]